MPEYREVSAPSCYFCKFYDPKTDWCKYFDVMTYEDCACFHGKRLLVKEES